TSCFFWVFFLYQFPSLPTEPAKHIKLTIKSSLNGQSQQPSSVLTCLADRSALEADYVTCRFQLAGRDARFLCAEKVLSGSNPLLIRR
ncbi:hypothetical protein, partial [Lacticaseibacillus rhamnosus]|uniref:hypothetical protein n=1 Tax=Lacticaseibacillus rhamnosus TaxID=47715 RepID=UPI001E3DDABD